MFDCTTFYIFIPLPNKVGIYMYVHRHDKFGFVGVLLKNVIKVVFTWHMFFVLLRNHNQKSFDHLIINRNKIMHALDYPYHPHLIIAV